MVAAALLVGLVIFFVKIPRRPVGAAETDSTAEARKTPIQLPSTIDTDSPGLKRVPQDLIQTPGASSTNLNAIATLEARESLVNAPATPPKARARREAVDPDARTALALVGLDDEAAAYWLSAINDPSIPAEERKDLIEDLNEDGFLDPKKPGLDDLPLILSRLILIEQLAPSAMDEVNMAAFLEAYKDLANMYERLVSR